MNSAVFHAFADEFEQIKAAGAIGDFLKKVVTKSAPKANPFATGGKHLRPGGLLPNTAPKIDPMHAYKAQLAGRVSARAPSGLQVAA